MQTLEKVGVVSLAKIYAMLALLGSLLIAIPYGLIVMVAGASGAFGTGTEVIAGGVVGGLAVMVLLPIIYTVMSFIGGLIFGLILNLVLSLSGGLEVEITSG